MELELVTTKQKLNKKIVNQMRYGTSLAVLANCNVLGYLVNAVKNVPTAILMESLGEYFVIPANYTKGDMSVYRRVGKWSQSKKFHNSSDCDEWWAAYTLVIEKAAKNQIFI